MSEVVEVLTTETLVLETPPVIELLAVQDPGAEVVVIDSAQGADLVELEVPGDIAVIEAAPEIERVVVQIDALEVIEIAEQGMPGPPGPSTGEAMPYAKRFDFVGENIIYRGEAEPGAAESAPVWRIARVDIVGDVVEMWAEGSAAFAHAWSARLDLEYR